MASSARQTKGTARAGSTARTGTSARKRRFFNYPRSHVKSFRRWLPSWRVLLGTFLTGTALVAGILIAAYATTSVPKDPAYAVQNQKTTVYYADGVTEIGTFQEENRVIVDYATLPDYVGNSVVASEDSSFWTNSGIDLKGIARALVNNLKGGSTQGASTITQQYAERYYAGATVSDYVGKFQEAMLALRLTQEQPKEEILGNYLNTIYFGRGAHGIEAAAQAYFGVPAAELTISQAAMITAIIPNPTVYDPANNPDITQAKWQRVINRMAADGHITAAEKAEAVFPADTLKEKVATNSKGGQAGYLLDLVRRELEAGDYGDGVLDTKGFTIVTTIDKSMQDLAVATAESIPREGEPHAASPFLRPSIVSIDPADGAVKAVYGGTDFVTQEFNAATRGVAQAGSTFKPFTLIAALEQGIDLSATYDGNNDVEVPGFYDEGQGVKNFDNGKFGTIDLATATANSVNTVYAALNMEVGPQATVDTAVKAGIPADSMDLKAVPSNVLGTASVHPLDIAHAYATFAAQGFESTPHVVQSVKRLGSGAETYDAPGRNERVFDADVMAAATYAMTQVVEAKGASGAPAKALNRPVAGKTGTSNDNKSAWFAGYMPQLATVVGLYQDNTETNTQEQITTFGEWAAKSRPQAITGGTWPVQAWTSYMEGVIALPQYAEVQEFPEYTMKKVKPSPTPTEEPTEPALEEPVEPEEPVAPATVTVPTDLTGRSKADARAVLEGMGLKVSFTEEYSADVAPGVVLRVGGSGQQVETGKTVTVVLSKGPDPKPKPDPEPEPSTPPPTTPPEGGGNQGNGNGNGNNGG